MRLMAVQDEISWQHARTFVGRTLEVLVAVGEGRKDEATHRLSGRAPDNRLVHVALPVGAGARPGDIVTAEVTYAAPHHLVADIVHGVRRTRAGDAWEARSGRGPTTGVTLGMPSIGVPAPSRPAADEPGCSGYLVDSAVGHTARDVTSP
jgi:tRNA-2-methylthio-N6-dimethylallyladenosine synthase